MECDTSIRYTGHAHLHFLASHCVDSGFDLKETIQRSDLSIRYHFGDYRSELPGNIGFDVMFFRSLLKSARESITGNNERNEESKGAFKILHMLMEWVMDISDTYTLQRGTVPKQFNQMYDKLHELDAKLAETVNALLYESVDANRKKLFHLMQNIGGYQDHLNLLESTQALEELLRHWRTIQADYMDWYMVFRILRYCFDSSTGTGNSSTTSFVLVGQAHAINITNILTNLGWHKQAQQLL